MFLNRATVIIFTFVVMAIIILCVSSPIQENILTCDCNHCDEMNMKNTIDLKEKEMTTTTPIITDEKKTNEKEINDDGTIICARDRDLEDKTFPSMCHMLCYNQCTRFRIATQKHKNITRFINAIYRTNYYKLWDGPC
ncbi:PREDICTED: uncharacterized protein LOC107070146 [Polistes dominula]|uniref:Uncharacterized protein LOC107070146 n=1 Tax=Polistes dominula TaxID=743375 RepID=A0ABM1ITK3_POLDO|nr:PREDICTED: uncharacterized protein LOC107070146 [Polistes dominula]